jgi:hypothetical protein
MENANSVATETDYSGIVHVYGLVYLKVIPLIRKKPKILQRAGSKIFSIAKRNILLMGFK